MEVVGEPLIMQQQVVVVLSLSTVMTEPPTQLTKYGAPFI